jgi:GT2 family glycosyltransferase
LDPAPVETPAPIAAESRPDYRYPLARGIRPEVSVCIVNWNGYEVLRACLESLLRAPQGVRHEVVVVDNGSTDGAADMVARDFPEVVLIRNSHNESFARGNNRAAARSRGRYLFFLNNDTVVPPYTLRRLRDFARSRPHLGIVGPRLVDGRGRTQVSARGRPTVTALLHRISFLRWTGLFRSAYRRYRGRRGTDCQSVLPAGTDCQSVLSVEVLMGAALFMPRTVFRACGRWDERYTFGGEDIDLCVRVGRMHEVLYHPDIALTHLGRVSSRQHIGYAHSNTVIGIMRQLRSSGTGALPLLAYRLALTLDAPLQWLAHASCYLSNRLRGRTDQAARSWLGLCAWGHFLTRGLLTFWRA